LPALSQLKRRIRDQVQRLPGEGRFIVGAYHRLALLKRQTTSKLHALRSPDQPDPDKVYWINPARIVDHTNYTGGDERKLPKDRVFDHDKDRGKVSGGSWDISDYEFDDLEVVQAIYARIRKGTPWRDTPFYASILRDLAEGRPAGWQIESEADLVNHCEYVDALIDSIRSQGYRLNSEVVLTGERKGISGHPRYAREVSVNISRSGQYLFQDGRHRLAVAKALGVERIPVKVLVRHQQWSEFRAFVKSLSMSGGASARRGELYQSLPHPDLKDIPAAHACEDRFNAIKKHIAPGEGAVLDIGCNLGYFCHGLEDLGYSCYALEYLPQVALAADKIRVAEGKTFRVLTNDLFVAANEEPLRGQKFKIVLALNIFHHFIKKRESFEKLQRWLARLDTDMMIFEPHSVAEPQMVGAYVNFDAVEFVEFITTNSVLRHWELIHHCDDGRSIYKLWK
jgi:2-polyprenyl-3-methyl-5-hydroxy-6-metoxy-1,4-benzoquinol methylase